MLGASSTPVRAGARRYSTPFGPACQPPPTCRAMDGLHFLAWPGIVRAARHVRRRHYGTTISRRSTRHLLVGLCGLRERAPERRDAPARHWGLRDRLRLRPDRGHDGVCLWPYLGLPYQPRGHHRPPAQQAVPRARGSRLHCRQVIGGILGGGVLYLIATGRAGFVPGGFASNGYGDHSPGGYSLLAGFCAETVFAFFFLLIILGSTDSRAPQGFAPLTIGLAVALINWAGIPVTNLSLNPARSTGSAVFADPWALQQLWLFWVAPILGGGLAGLVYPVLAGAPASSPKR